jgi:phytoene synthase
LSSDSGLADDYCLDAVRRGDRDRYLTVLFASRERRRGLLALYAFNLEIARARESVSEPMLGRIRLQWWRESLDAIFADAAARPHPVAIGLAAAVKKHGLARDPLERMLAARERDMDASPIPDRSALLAYAEATTMPILDLASRILEPEITADTAIDRTLRPLAIGYALTGLLRAVPFHAAAGRVYLPEDAMRRAGLAVQDLLAPAEADKRCALVADIAAIARGKLNEARQNGLAFPRAGRSVLLGGAVARAHLGRLERAGWDPLHPAVRETPPWMIWSLMLRSLTGRI